MNDINETLNTSFNNEKYKNKNKIIEEINKWSNSIRNTPIKDLGMKIKILKISIKEFYRVELVSFCELREFQNLSRPFYDTLRLKRNMKEQDIDIWSSQVNKPNNFIEKSFDSEISGSEDVHECPKCNALGEIGCLNCSKNGKLKCDSCNGNGKTVCHSCNGKGQKMCLSCWGKGTVVGIGGIRTTCRWCVMGYQTCSSCQNGYNNCSNCGAQGFITCNNCSGHGRIICPNCKGLKLVEDYYNIHTKFFNIKKEKLLNENNIPFELIDRFSSKIFHKLIFDFQDEKISDNFIEKINNNIFNNNIKNITIESSKDIENYNVNNKKSIKLHQQSIKIYRSDDFIEVVFKYSESSNKKNYYMYFFNNFESVWSKENPINDIVNNYISESKKFLDKGKYKKANEIINKALEIFPFDDYSMEVKAMIKSKILKANLKIGGIIYFIFWVCLIFLSINLKFNENLFIFLVILLHVSIPVAIYLRVKSYK